MNPGQGTDPTLNLAIFYSNKWENHGDKTGMMKLIEATEKEQRQIVVTQIASKLATVGKLDEAMAGFDKYMPAPYEVTDKDMRRNKFYHHKSRDWFIARIGAQGSRPVSIKERLDWMMANCDSEQAKYYAVTKSFDVFSEVWAGKVPDEIKSARSWLEAQEPNLYTDHAHATIAWNLCWKSKVDFDEAAQYVEKHIQDPELKEKMKKIVEGLRKDFIATDGGSLGKFHMIHPYSKLYK